MTTSRLLRTLGLAVTLVTVASCTGECNVGGIDPEKVEASIVSGVKSQLDVEVTADCGEENIPEKTGETFECTVTASDGDEAQATVEMLGDGNISWEVPGLNPGEFESTISDHLVEQDGGGTVECGTLPIPERVGESFECTVTHADGTPGVVIVDMLGEGRVDMEVRFDEPGEAGDEAAPETE